jgi:hypothetical protein
MMSTEFTCVLREEVLAPLTLRNSAAAARERKSECGRTQARRLRTLGKTTNTPIAR